MTAVLDALQRDLDAARGGALSLSGLAGRLRAAPVPNELPARFGEVLAGLADRLESSALFSGESCSFSEEDLLGAVQAWIDRARDRLAG